MPGLFNDPVLNDLASRLAENQREYNQELESDSLPDYNNRRLLAHENATLNGQIRDRVAELAEANPDTITQITLPPEKQARFKQQMNEYRILHSLSTDSEKPKEINAVEKAYLKYLAETRTRSETVEKEIRDAVSIAYPDSTTQEFWGDFDGYVRDSINTPPANNNYSEMCMAEPRPELPGFSSLNLTWRDYLLTTPIYAGVQVDVETFPIFPERHWSDFRLTTPMYTQDWRENILATPAYPISPPGMIFTSVGADYSALPQEYCSIYDARARPRPRPARAMTGTLTVPMPETVIPDALRAEEKPPEEKGGIIIPDRPQFQPSGGLIIPEQHQDGNGGLIIPEQHQGNAGGIIIPDAPEAKNNEFALQANAWAGHFALPADAPNPNLAALNAFIASPQGQALQAQDVPSDLGTVAAFVAGTLAAGAVVALAPAIAGRFALQYGCATLFNSAMRSFAARATAAAGQAALALGRSAGLATVGARAFAGDDAVDTPPAAPDGAFDCALAAYAQDVLVFAWRRR